MWLKIASWSFKYTMCLLWYEKLSDRLAFSMLVWLNIDSLPAPLHRIPVSPTTSCCLPARGVEVKMWGIIKRIWQGASSKHMLQMFDKMSVRVTHLVCLSPFAELFLLFEVAGIGAANRWPTKVYSLMLAWTWVLPACLLHKDRGREQIQSCKAPLNTNTVPVSQQASLLPLCTQFKHCPLLWLICSSAGIVDLFDVIVVLFSQRELK